LFDANFDDAIIKHSFKGSAGCPRISSVFGSSLRIPVRQTVRETGTEDIEARVNRPGMTFAFYSAS
jgi:hypothetical protein